MTTAPVEIRDPEIGEETTRDRPWMVIVWNDPVNLMSYVVMVFKKIFGFDEATARRHMLEVHEQGRSIVWSGLREKAEAYVFTLQQWRFFPAMKGGVAIDSAFDVRIPVSVQ